jgi:hypothetical protein
MAVRPMEGEPMNARPIERDQLEMAGIEGEPMDVKQMEPGLMSRDIGRSFRREKAASDRGPRSEEGRSHRI